MFGIEKYSIIITLLSAELLFLIIRSNDLVIIVKKRIQRLETEQQRVNNGLCRSIIFEALVIVPASSFLVYLISPLIIPQSFLVENPVATYALIGVVSVGFPFVAIKELVKRVALNTLREFSGLREDRETS